jgi:hypothetical protein
MSQLGELKLQNSIDKRIGELVGTAERLITERTGTLKLIEVNQIRNAMAVANSAPHVAVVTNFIRYQMGRTGAPGRAWKETGLGEAVNKEIDSTMQRLADETIKEAGFGEINAVQAQLTRLLLGFMHRRYVYEADKLKVPASK